MSTPTTQRAASAVPAGAHATRLRADETPTATESATTQDDRLQALAEGLLDDLRAGRLQLPTLPDLALQINAIAQSEDGTVSDATRAIARDPAIAARVMHAANSAYSASRTRVQSVQAAVTRLGLQFTRTLVHRLALEQMFLADSLCLQDLAHSAWKESLRVAALSEAIARRHSDLRPEAAMLAGLMHLVGMLPIIQRADASPELARAPAALHRLIDRLHPQLGSRTLAHWGFPMPLQEVPRAHVDPQRQHTGPADYTDIVLCARLLLGLSAADSQDIPARNKLGLPPEATLETLPELFEAFEQNLDYFFATSNDAD